MESRTRVGLILNLTSKQDFKIDRYYIYTGGRRRRGRRSDVKKMRELIMYSPFLLSKEPRVCLNPPGGWLSASRMRNISPLDIKKISSASYACVTKRNTLAILKFCFRYVRYSKWVEFKAIYRDQTRWKHPWGEKNPWKAKLKVQRDGKIEIKSNETRLWTRKKAFHETNLNEYFHIPSNRGGKKKKKRKKGKKIHMEKDGGNLPSFPWNVN